MNNTNHTISSNNHTLKSRNPIQRSLTKSQTIETKKSKNLPIPKDLNQYKHLLSTSSTTPSDLNWLFKLRAYSSTPSLINDSSKQLNPPSFYNEDLSKHRKKAKLRIVYSTEPFYKSQNSFSLYHLVNKGKVNSTQLNFQSTLRDFNKNTKTNYIWNNLAYNPTPNQAQSSFLLPMLAKSKEKYRKIDNFLLKRYKTFVQKIKYGKDMIHQRVIKEDKTCMPVESGYHLNMGKYNLKYENKNISEIRHLLRDTNSMAMFEIGLREGIETTNRNYNNKIRQRNVEESAFHKNNPTRRFQ